MSLVRPCLGVTIMAFANLANLANLAGLAGLAGLVGFIAVPNTLERIGRV